MDKNDTLGQFKDKDINSIADFYRLSVRSRLQPAPCVLMDQMCFFNQTGNNTCCQHWRLNTDTKETLMTSYSIHSNVHSTLCGTFRAGNRESITFRVDGFKTAVKGVFQNSISIHSVSHNRQHAIHRKPEMWAPTIVWHSYSILPPRSSGQHIQSFI